MHFINQGCGISHNILFPSCNSQQSSKIFFFVTHTVGNSYFSYEHTNSYCFVDFQFRSNILFMCSSHSPVQHRYIHSSSHSNNMAVKLSKCVIKTHTITHKNNNLYIKYIVQSENMCMFRKICTEKKILIFFNSYNNFLLMNCDYIANGQKI